MPARVRMDQRTWILLAITFVVAGVIAWLRVEEELARRPAAPPPQPPMDLVEVEIVSP